VDAKRDAEFIESLLKLSIDGPVLERADVIKLQDHRTILAAHEQHVVQARISAFCELPTSAATVTGKALFRMSPYRVTTNGDLTAVEPYCCATQ
jgi:hypothetical protein